MSAGLLPGNIPGRLRRSRCAERGTAREAERDVEKAASQLRRRLEVRASVRSGAPLNRLLATVAVTRTHARRRGAGRPRAFASAAPVSPRITQSFARPGPRGQVGRPFDPVPGTGSPGATSLRRVLGLTEVTAGGVGIIIGAGIYVLLGAATAHAGALVWLAFLLAAAMSVLTGLSYAELSSMFPSAAGEYEYTRHAMPEWIAFTVGWMMISGLVVAAATVSIGFARYVGYFVDVDQRVAALGLIVAVSAIAMTGIKQSARLTVGLSAIQVGGLVLVVAVGLPHIGEVDLLAGPGLSGLLSAAGLVFFAFIGFDDLQPRRGDTRSQTNGASRPSRCAGAVDGTVHRGRHQRGQRPGRQCSRHVTASALRRPRSRAGRCRCDGRRSHRGRNHDEYDAPGPHRGVPGYLRHGDSVRDATLPDAGSPSSRNADARYHRGGIRRRGVRSLR